MKEPVLADGDHEDQVEDDGEGGEGGVAGHPEPLQMPGQLLYDVFRHLNTPASPLTFFHESINLSFFDPKYFTKI